MYIIQKEQKMTKKKKRIYISNNGVINRLDSIYNAILNVYFTIDGLI